MSKKNSRKRSKRRNQRSRPGQKGSLKFQAVMNLRSKYRPKQSRHEHKKEGTADQFIFGRKTLSLYIDNVNRGFEWIREKHPEVGNDLEKAREFVPEYIEFKKSEGLTTDTLRTIGCAFGKLYDCSSTDWGVHYPPRRAINATRSRGPAKRDKHFSEKNNQPLIAFACTTGLRRNELEKLRGSDLRELGEVDGVIQYGVFVKSGSAKGGRERVAPLIGPPEEVQLVVDMMKKAGEDTVWGKVHSAADIHWYRHIYATRSYDSMAVADPDSLPYGKKFRYDCRGKRKGQRFDAQAAAQTALNLGHGGDFDRRVDTVVNRYLYDYYDPDRPF